MAIGRKQERKESGGAMNIQYKLNWTAKKSSLPVERFQNNDAIAPMGSRRLQSVHKHNLKITATSNRCNVD